LECWNVEDPVFIGDGTLAPVKQKEVSRGKNKMGFEELTEWFIGKIKYTKYERNAKFGSNP
jgi:hypothetical protein